MRTVCAELRRPYWMHIPGAMMRIVLGEMADLVLHGRVSSPQQLLQAGFEFVYPDIRSATHDLLSAVRLVTSVPRKGMVVRWQKASECGMFSPRPKAGSQEIRYGTCFECGVFASDAGGDRLYACTSDRNRCCPRSCQGGATVSAPVPEPNEAYPTAQASESSASQSVSGFSLSLRKAWRDGKQVNADVCFSLPNSSDWTIWAAHYEYGGTVISEFSSSLLSKEEAQPDKPAQRCDQISFYVPPDADLSASSFDGGVRGGLSGCR